MHCERLAHLGICMPKGVLLCGPPGCSKMVLVHTIVAKSGINFIAIHGLEVGICCTVLLFR